MTVSEAPFDLAALGVDHPHRRWKAACDELHRQEARELREAEQHWRRIGLLIRAQIAWEKRGSPGWAPAREDIEEAALEIAAVAVRALA